MNTPDDAEEWALEYQAWIDFWREGHGDYDAFLASDELRELRAEMVARRLVDQLTK